MKMLWEREKEGTEWNLHQLNRCRDPKVKIKEKSEQRRRRKGITVRMLKVKRKPQEKEGKP